MLAMLLLFLVTAASCFAAVVFFGRRYEEALPLSVFSVILLLFAFGLMGLLRPGVYIVCALSLCVLLLALFFALRRGSLRAARALFFTPAFFLFAALTAAVVFANAGRLVIEFDEYSHWALAVKSMVRYGVLAAAAPEAVPFATYPPALSLLQYFAMTLNGSFSEGLLYMCCQFMGFALLMPALREANFRQTGKNLLFALALVLVPIVFKANLYGSVLADCLMGLTCGYAFSVLLLNRERGLLEWASLCAALAVLALTKDTGLFFAVALYAALLVDTLCFSRAQRGRVAPLACAFALPAAARGAWALFVSASGAVDKFSSPLDFSALRGGGAGRVVSGFVERLFAADEGICLLPVSAFQALTLLAGLLLFTFWRFSRKEPAEARRLRALFYMLGATAAAFLFGILLAYLTGFDPEESQYAPSFARYLSPALYALLLPPLALWSERLLARKDASALLSAACIALCLLFVSPVDKLAATLARYSVGNSQSIRADYDAAAERILSAVPGGEARIRILSQTEDDLDRYALAYLLYPMTVDEAWRYTEAELTRGAQWETDAARLDYVYFYRGDEALRSFFADRTIDASGQAALADGTLWRVESESGRLAPVW